MSYHEMDELNERVARVQRQMTPGMLGGRTALSRPVRPPRARRKKSAAGGSGGTGNPVPFDVVVVAAVNSTAKGKEQADFVCDGVDDQVELKSAIRLGYRVLLLEGVYRLTDTVVPYYVFTDASLEGMGRRSTLIQMVEPGYAFGGFRTLNLSYLTVMGRLSSSSVTVSDCDIYGTAEADDVAGDNAYVTILTADFVNLEGCRVDTLSATGQEPPEAESIRGNILGNIELRSFPGSSDPTVSPVLEGNVITGTVSVVVDGVQLVRSNAMLNTERQSAYLSIAQSPFPRQGPSAHVIGNIFGYTGGTPSPRVLVQFYDGSSIRHIIAHNDMRGGGTPIDYDTSQPAEFTELAGNAT